MRTLFSLLTFLMAVASGGAVDSPPDTQIDQKIDSSLIRSEALWREVLRYTQRVKPDEAFDWPRIEAELLNIGNSKPDYDHFTFRNAAQAILARARKHSPDAGSRLAGTYLSSRNQVLRELANADQALADARNIPPEMRFTALDGRQVDLESLRGKIVLIDFWAATWCGACKVQEPLMKEVYSKYHDMGFEIIGIACEMKESDRPFLIDYVKKHEMAWPQFFDGKGMNNEYTRRYGFNGIPQYFLLDKKGLLVFHTASSTGLTNLEAVVRNFLGLPPLHPGDENKALGMKDQSAGN